MELIYILCFTVELQCNCQKFKMEKYRKNVHCK